MSTADERAAAGAAWLDKHVPDWLNQIDTGRLDLADCSACMLGQIYRDYWNAPLVKDGLGFEYCRQANALGFNDELGQYNELTDAWLRLIDERRSE